MKPGAEQKKSVFKICHQNKSQVKSSQVKRKSERQKCRPTGRQTDRKTERLFSLVIKTKVVQNVNRMSENIVSTCQYVDMSECNFSV